MIDTGAAVSIVTEETANRLKYDVQPTDIQLTGADGKPLNCLGEIKMDLVSAAGIGAKGAAYVLRGGRDNLLGRPEIQKFGLIKSVYEVNANIERSHPSLFGKLGTLPDVFKIHLKDNSSPLCLQVPRRLPLGLWEPTRIELERMESLGVIRKIEKPTSWCSGMVVAPKSNGKVRICVDLTQLNKSVKREFFPLPRLEEIMSSLEGSTCFSKMDANSGFWQIRLDEESQEYTTFITPFGRWVFCKMPFGVSAAPEFFQRQMTKILEGLTGVVCMMDDILVVGKDRGEHDARLDLVLRRLEEAGLTLNKGKCEFGVSEVKFLGHVLNKEGISVDPCKEKAISDMPAPVDRKGLRRFLAMVNYLSRFSPRLSEAQLPLRELDKNNSSWMWGSHQQDSFEEVKKIISTSPVLALFDYRKEHRVTADASKHTLGAALLQCNDKGEWQPVTYASRKLTDAEQRYGQIEKEALAATWACEKFDYYLVGRHFEIETDHKPLIPLLGQKDLSDLPLRVQRFKMRLMRYDYRIFHTPGIEMFLADMLSRPPSPAELVKIGRVERHVRAVILAEDDELLKEVRRRSREDDDYTTILQALRGDWPEILSTEVTKVKGNASSLSLIDGLIMMNSRIYIPRAMRKELLRKLHSGHQGIVKTYRRSRDSVWWPSIRQEVYDMVENCSACIKERNTPHQPLEMAELPAGPWLEIATDLMEFRGKHYAIFVDYYSRWIEAVKVENQTGQELVKRFKSIIARLGAPKRIRSDNGPCYISREWRQLMDRYSIHHETSSPHYPESNGLAERAVQIVKNLWKKEEDKAHALLAYRTTPLESGSRPDELMLGRKIRNDLPVQHQLPACTKGFEERDRALKQRQKRNHDKTRRAKDLPELEEGDIVWAKLSHDDEGKRAVVKYNAEEPQSYWVEIDGRLIRRNRKHLRLLREETQEVEEKHELFPEGEPVNSRPVVSRSGRAIRRRQDDQFCFYK